MAGSTDLQERLLTVIGRGAGASVSDIEFERLALEIFEWQYERNSLYRSYCAARGATPSSVRTHVEIPAVPTDAFKAAPLLCGNPADAKAVFRTSGTTRGGARRGTHYLLDTKLYRAALMAGFRTHLIPDRPTIRIASLIPPPEALPDSSLSFMMGTVVTELGSPGSDFHFSDDRLEIDGFLHAARAAADEEEPLLVAGTSFAFVHLLDALSSEVGSLDLPAGSRVMDTGGFKGQSREVDRSELYGMIERRLGVPASHIVNEYGMTEMSSQLYDGVAGTAPALGAHRIHRGPGWLRTVAVDPETLQPLEHGETGVLRHVDLANLDSVMALQTADLGRVTADGVELLGRATGAETRGCSIAMDELLALME